MVSIKSQTSVEYLLLIGASLLAIIVAVLAFMKVTETMAGEFESFSELEGNLMEVMLS